ncbi:hypothetical protein BJ138DRAFT_1149486 [Hygrophoropsis aurantiaca]|uniref:Uncharacterized protein n=1 Tax=Hygrophoropsis aurantiaca TaxID=72124 RepID=A0ACB8AFC5_9AGAM|nr:hypothetical protein BJ138DRAFT_1149486 [Hygrophoropsis aurantiaca]
MSSSGPIAGYKPASFSVRDDKIPPRPPPDSFMSAPLPPPKLTDPLNSNSNTSRLDDSCLPPIPTIPSLDFNLSPVLQTTTEPSDSSKLPPSPVERSKKSSPLTDLIESEKVYVDYLTGVIRKVAAAWSRSNLPPKELDTMFRSVEGVYKTNRTLLGKLREIGASPSSPKALGDLLMRWIDDLDRPYTTYCTTFCSGFDDWEPVRSNSRLPGVLQAFTETNPPSSAITQLLDSVEPTMWTLDSLFLLPKSRLRYYRKLYSRLLKSTTPGRSDHRLLVAALEKLDNLLTVLDGRAQLKVGDNRLSFADTAVVRDEGDLEANRQEEFRRSDNSPPSGKHEVGAMSAPVSTRGSSTSSGERFSRETESTSVSRESTIAIPSVSDLERKLATDRTLDLFTMEPKQVRLQMAPPTLPYARELRASVNVVIRFTPQATGVEVVHRYGHVYVLSDLFLVCEKMSLEDRASMANNGPDMWLCYPPLSGKVLRVSEVSGQDNALQVTIMRKETLILEAETTKARNDILAEFMECIAFAKAMSGAASEPVPPLPQLNGLPRSPAASLVSGNSAPLRERPERAERPSPRIDSPSHGINPGHDIRSSNSAPQSPTSPGSFSGQPPQQFALSQPRSSLQSFEGDRHHVHQSGMNHTVQAGERNAHWSNPASPNTQAHSSQRVPSLQNLPPGYMYPARKSSAGHVIISQAPSSFNSASPIVPPARTASIRSQGPLSPSNPNFTGEPGGTFSPPAVQPYQSRQPLLHHQPSTHTLRHQPSLPSLPPRTSIHQYQQSSLPSHATYHQPSFHHPEQPGESHGPSPRSFGQHGPPHGMPPPRPPSEPSASSSGRLHKSASSRSLASRYEFNEQPAPPLPSFPDDLPMPSRPYAQRKGSVSSLNSAHSLQSRPLLPSMQMGSRGNSYAGSSIQDPSPPTSPVQETKPLGPVKSTVAAQMKCKVFHQQQHAQWKSLGSAKLTLYRQEPTNVKQLVVEADSKDKTLLISTIVLTDGVERVGKTGVAIELSDAKGARTGIIYMIQLRNETSAGGLFETLLAGSDRSSK